MSEVSEAPITTKKEAISAGKSAGILQSFIGNNLAIDDYDADDRTRPIEEVVSVRLSHVKQNPAPLLGGDPEKSLAGANPSLLATAVDSLAKYPPSESVIMTVSCRKRPPENWIPPLEALFLYQPAAERFPASPESQRGLCYGCGSPFGSAAPRKCEYTGRYFCKMCFPSGSVQSIVPAKVVAHWDFTEYDVNPRSAGFISRILTRPLIDVSAVHPELYTKIPNLKDVHHLRQKLFYMKDLVLHCESVPDRDPARFALHALPSYLYTDVDIYSLSDLMHLEKLTGKLLTLIEAWVAHIGQCESCSSHAAQCPICEKDDKLFLFQILDVDKCPTCGTVFHRKCLEKEGCPNCKDKKEEGSSTVEESS